MKVVLKSGREKSIVEHHPWLFASAIKEVWGSPDVGDTVEIHTADGYFIAWGAYSPLSQIRVRVWSWDIEQKIDNEFLFYKIQQAINKRSQLSELKTTDAYRLISAEADGLPGLIVDKYAEVLVLQCLSAGIEKWKNGIVDSIYEISDGKNLYERSDANVRSLEGLPLRSGYLCGRSEKAYVEISENGLKFIVNFIEGQKTGFYLDQRQSRLLVRNLVKSCKVLDCFSYTGSFSLSAIYGDAARVIAVDTSKNALEIAQANQFLNNFGNYEIEYIEADVFQVLRTFRDRDDKFDFIILDPPKFAPTISQVDRAARGYKDINLLAFKLLKPGGKLLTFSCSGGVTLEFFQKIVRGAAVDANVNAQIVGIIYQAHDHPIVLNFPESFYLKGLLLEIQ